MKKIQRALLPFCLILLCVKIGLGQGVQSLTITPNPACTTTPVTVDIEYFLSNGCYSYVGYTSAWSGNIFNVYLNFNYSGGPICPQIFTTGNQIINLGTLSAGSYIVRVFDFDLGGGLLQTGTFSVANCCPTPTGLTTSYVHYSTFTLQWNSVAQAVCYKTRVRLAGNNNPWVEQSSWSNLTSHIWYNATPNSNYECQVRDSCASGIGAWSSSYVVTTQGAGDPYCYSYGNSSDDWINAVQIGAINNASGNNYGYRNYTNYSTTVQKGQSYPITVTPNTDNGQNPVNWRIWIDFNRDNDFSDPGELVVSATGNDQTPLNSTISIPATASIGTTRMRIVMGSSSISGPCESLDNRDVEDYTLNISAGTCATPTGLTATYIHYSTFVLQWNNVSGALGYKTRINRNGAGWEEQVNWTTGNSIQWCVVVPNSTYECQVRDSCALGVSAWSSSYYVTTLGAGDPYCYSYGNSITEWIDATQFGSINNVSGNNCGYRNYTNLSTTVQQGQSYPITITPATNNGQQSVNWRVWIDFNHDNDFLDAGELVVTSTGNDQTSLNATISIPATANTGTTRMRIEMANATISGPCDVNGLRDIEDYTINITAAPILTVSPANITVGSPSGSTSFTINTNCTSWSVTGAPSWITAINPSSGNGTSTVSVQYQENTSTQSRSATLTISGCGLTQTVVITQSGATPTMSITPPTIILGAGSGTTSFTIITNCTSWNITGAPSWITSISPGSGSNGTTTVSVQYQQNTSIQSRSATLTISGCGLTQILTITQSGATPTMSVSPSIINVGASSGNTTFIITTNCTAWSITGAPSWITSVSPGSGNGTTTVSVQYQQNASIQSRTATLTISGCGLSQTVTIIQSGATPTMSISPTTINVGAGSGSTSFTVTTNCTAWSISGAPAWVTSVSPGSGANGATTINVQYQQNASIQSRTATLTISGCGLSQIVVITQSGATPTMSISPSTITVGANSGNTLFTVTTNCTAWSISGAPSWINSVSPSSGNGTTTVSVQYQQNTSIQSRTATLTISGCGLTQTVTITQNGANAILSVSPSTITFNETGGSASFTIGTNCTSWSISGVPNWLTVSPVIGNGTTTVSVQCGQNTGSQTRSATLTVSGCGVTQDVVVTQSAVNIILSVFPDVLNFDAAGGSSSCTINTNCTTWSITGAPSWLTVTPSNGNGATVVSIQCQQNTSTQSRSATLTISGCGLTRTVSVTQSGTNTILTVSPAAITVGSPAGNTSFSITSNCSAWSISGAPSWITAITPGSGSGNSSVTVQYEQNTSNQSRNATLIISGCGLTTNLVITQSGGTSFPVPWVVTATGSNHTIILPGTMMSDILGSPLQAGDAIGAFFDNNGTLQCGGFGIWTGSTTAFAAYGNDTIAPAKNGFSADEVFKIKVWRASTGQEYTANATYEPVGTGGIVSHTDKYAGDGISMLAKVLVNAKVVLNIPLNTGWNMISSNVVPDLPNMVDVFANIASKVIQVKDDVPASYFPSAGLNQIGNWNVLKGYQVKASQTTTLSIQGLQVVPENTPIPLNVGWQIIAYLRNSPKNIVEVFSGIQNQIAIVKDNDGKVYTPQFNINTIGNMKTGQGYKVKALAPVTLTYMANLAGHDPEQLKPGYQLSLHHFVLDSAFNTGNNAIIIVPQSVVSTLLQPGDEIGVFTEQGTLCGAGIYNGENMAVTVWGDDATTAGIQEGMFPGETYQLKVWKAAEEQEYAAMAQFSVGDDVYQPDDLEVLSNISLTSPVREVLSAGFTKLHLYPNPAREYLYLQLNAADDMRMQISICQPDGRPVLDLNKILLPAGPSVQQLTLPQTIPAGMYFLKISTDKGITGRRIFIEPY